MKIIHLSTELSEQSACKRISDSIKEENIYSDILTLKGNSINSSNVNYKIRNKISNKVEYIFKNYINLEKERYISLNFTGVNIEYNNHILESDIVHIHWINGGYISLSTLIKLKNIKKNIVWTVHDSWPFTAICHVRNGCDYYKKDCEECILLKRGYSKLLKTIMRTKQKIYEESNIIFVFPSNVHKEYAMKSSIFRNISSQRIKVIGNPIQIENFYDEEYIKDKEKIYLGFGAIGGINNKLKGFEHLKIALLNILNNKKYLDRLVLVIFGANESKEILNQFVDMNIEVVNRGYASSYEELRKIYSSIDIFISPSFEESFGQTLAESMACGCLGIAYKETGCTDIIDDNINGFLAEYKNILSLEEKILNGIKRIEEGYDRSLSTSSINSKYNSKRIGDMYKELYHNIIGEKK